VPTLRNVDKRPNETFVKRYMHNGFFSSLQDVVHFYNTRDVLPICGFSGSEVGKNCWPLPEVALNANPNVGHLGLTDEEEEDIVSFLKTLSDGFIPPK
jgi:cytochrome c peroxidase